MSDPDSYRRRTAELTENLGAEVLVREYPRWSWRRFGFEDGYEFWDGKEALHEHEHAPSVDDASPLRVGDPLYGFCGGFFGRDGYGDKRVEAIGSDWVVARGENGTAWFADGPPERLREYRTPEVY